MTIEEKLKQKLPELDVHSGGDIHVLYSQLRQDLEEETSRLRQAGASDEAEREKVWKVLRDRWLGRKSGRLSQADENWLKAAPKELKPDAGRHFNTFREFTVEVIERLRDEIPIRRQPTPVTDSVGAIEAGDLSDLTLPGYRRPLGSIHPVTRVQREIEDIFLSLGFSIETGPEVETVYYNFDALNIPESHPARDDWDTIYVDAKTVLRTHTSPVQIRAMEKYGAPLYIIVPGKCYRHDNPDSSHSPMFHQIEGLAVDKDVTFADLKGTLDLFAKKFFGESIRTNFFPSFFPFTEPSGDLAISCVICGGQGCRTCKESGWLEVMGCGMVHPDVLERVGLDPNRYSGWAFGLGLDRFAMMKYGINDIQLFFQSDLRFLEQF
jgi:phenylalanyl-tRNA synthetase alpha chain